LKGWVEKLNQALANGYGGLRLTGNTLWLERKDWNDFVNYEAEVDRVLGNYNMIALCTYSLDRCSATEIIDVVTNNQFDLIKSIEDAKGKRGSEVLGQEVASFYLPMIEKARRSKKAVTFQYHSPYVDKDFLTSYVVRGDMLISAQMHIT
jgi:hypothetical protein